MSATPEQIAEPHSFSPDEIAQRIEHFGASFDLDVMKQAAALIRAQAERVRVLEGEVEKVTRWANTSLDSVKAVMWRYEDALKQISGTSSKLCPFTRGVPNNLQPEDPCPVCGDKGDFSDETTSAMPQCVGNAPSAIARAALKPAP